MEATKQTVMKQVREHLVQIRKHDKQVEKLSVENSWFLHENIEEKYLPVLIEMYHVSELATQLEALVLFTAHHHELVDFKKLENLI